MDTGVTTSDQLGVTPAPPINISHDVNILADDPSTLIQLQFHAYTIALPVVLLLGVIGNALNIMVLTRGRFRHSLDEGEKCAAAVMLAMAVSDLAFCLVGLPTPLLSVSQQEGSSTLQITALYYATYRTPLSNMFIFCSTWLVAVVALERYLAVCRPLHRGHHRLRNTIGVVVFVFVSSLLFNLPGFLKYEVRVHPCPDTGHCYFVVLTSLYMSTVFRRVYRGMWLAIGALLPLVVMATCNAYLLVAIYKSRQRNEIEGSEDRYSTSRITLILVSIVTLFLILVFPATLLGFIGDMVLPHEVKQFFSYQVAIVTFNFTQAVYFAMHFVLYCSASRSFRESVGCPPQCGQQHKGRNTYRAVVFNRARQC